MRLLLVSLCLTAAGCYDPDLSDCVDCAAAPGLEVVVDGKGELRADDHDLRCAGSSDEEVICAFDVAAGVEIDVIAVEVHHRWEFAGWSSETCAGEDERCRVTVPADGAIVAARFAPTSGDDDDDDD